MKHSVILLTMVMMLGACSTDSHESGGPPTDQRGLGEELNQNRVENSDAIANDNGPEIASNGTIATPVEHKSDSNPMAPAPAPVPQQTVEAEKITPPNQVTGAYLTATVLPRGSGAEPLRVGLAAMKDEKRIGTDRSVYQTNWQLSFNEAVANPVKMLASSDARYDQVIEFYGSSMEFKQMAGAIKVYLQVTETASSLNSLTDSLLSELVDGQSVPEAPLMQEEIPQEEVVTPVENPVEEPVLTELPPQKPKDGLTEVPTGK